MKLLFAWSVHRVAVAAVKEEWCQGKFPLYQQSSSFLSAAKVRLHQAVADSMVAALPLEAVPIRAVVVAPATLGLASTWPIELSLQEAEEAMPVIQARPEVMAVG